MKQRLRLAAVSRKLLDIYAEDGMTLEQLMAFTVTDDHARQEQVWEALSQVLQQGAVLDPPHADRRARSAPPTGARSSSASKPMRPPAASSCATCSRTTMAAGCRTPALLDRLVAEKLKAEAESIARRGLEMDRGRGRFPYGHTTGLRQLDRRADRSHRRRNRPALEALRAEVRPSSRASMPTPTSCPTRSMQRLGEIETALAALRGSADRSTIRPRSRAPASSSASTATAASRSSAAIVRPEDEAARSGRTAKAGERRER